MAMEIESNTTPLEVKVYCNNEICAHNGKEMKYDVRQQPSTLAIHSLCVGCLNRVIVKVKL